jgi:very-short-patch-repair endonuclease
VYQAVYSLGKPATTPQEIAMAAVLAGGKGALLSDLWGLWLYGLARLPNTCPDVTVPRSRRGVDGVKFHRVRTMPEADCQLGIPVTTPARTIADCAPLLTERQLRRAVNQAQVKNLTSAEKLLQHRATRDLVNEHGATRSLLEDLLFELSRDFGLPLPEINEVVHGVEVDFYYPHLKAIIEADGFSFHFTKIAFEDDHERRLYLQAKGEDVIAVDYAQVTKGRATTAERLRTILGRG